MSPGRQLLIIAHRYVGLAIAIFIIIIALTGSLLAYLQPISAWLSPELYEAPGRGVVLSPAALAAHAQRAEPLAQIEDWPLDLREGQGVDFYVTGKTAPLGYDQLWLDPVTGAVLGRVNSEILPPTRHSLMSFVYRLHYALALPGNWGVWIVGIVSILWFFDCFVGAVLTFPRGRPFFKKWQPAWGVKTKRLNYDLHRAGGLWPWLLLATLALSGIYFNLGREVFLPVFDRIATRSAEPFDTRPTLLKSDIKPAAIDADTAVQIATRTASTLHWSATPQSISHRAEQGFWQVYYDKPKAQWATAGSYGLFIDDQSGVVIFIRRPGGTGGDVFLNWLSDLHVGGVGGAPYKLALCLLGVVIAMLSVTGLVIWWRKRRVRLRVSSPALRLPETRQIHSTLEQQLRKRL